MGKDGKPRRDQKPLPTGLAGRVKGSPPPSEAVEVAGRDLRMRSRDAEMGGFFQACCQRALVSARDALGACGCC